MPFFVFSYMATSLGVRDMVDATCWDMLCSIETYRHTCPSVEVRGEIMRGVFGRIYHSQSSTSHSIQTCLRDGLVVFIQHIRVVFQIFSNFLREVYDPDDQLLFLYARHLMVQQLGLNLSSKHKVKQPKTSGLYLAKGSVATQSHPLLTDGARSRQLTCLGSIVFCASLHVFVHSFIRSFVH